ncbi:nitroreductase family protein [Heliobacterium chlorum]|uniref:Nitroreductase family protein n=1 Tax=Heliobacterium chlorum TaxID=2698 RepID=A0ABR7T648_HELCL|nr:nitroreductase family protein [Heliobacterium chlorum]MBC9786245.1 nitroreductase family protein [Heliobacterium chlorum]
MDVIEAISKRRSCRKFKDEPIPDEKVTALLEVARLAPSGGNIQPWRFVVVKSEETRNQLAQATPMPFVPKAPVVFVCCVDSQVFSPDTVGTRFHELKEAGAFLGTPLEEMRPEDYAKRRNSDPIAARAYLGLNAAIAIDHITLRAVELGLGTCWVMMFDQEKLKNILNIEERYHVIALLPVGIPQDVPGPRPRIPIKDVLLKEI